MNQFIDELISGKVLPMDAYQDKKTGDVHIDIDLPGIQKNDLKVRAEKDFIRIEGSRESNFNSEDHRVLGPANRWKSINFGIPVKDFMDTKNLSADYNNGVLSLKVPKKEAFKHADIDVNFS